MKISDYPYLYETHLHTCESSKCARSTGAEMARACKEAGYTGIIVTDHSWYGNNCIHPALPWEEWITEFCRGYEHAKAWGDENDLDVFFGYEANYNGAEFLIYGVDKESHAWMKPYVETEVGDIDDNAIQKAIDTIEENSGSKINFIVCSAGVRRALVKYYKTNGIRLSDVEIEGGYKAITFNGIPVVVDRFCPDFTMYLLNTDDFCLHQVLSKYILPTYRA